MPGDGACQERDAFNGFQPCTLDNSLARKMGFRFSEVRTAVATILLGFQGLLSE
jgi:hypothetical protein